MLEPVLCQPLLKLGELTFCFLGQQPDARRHTRAARARFVGFGITSPGDWVRRAEQGQLTLPWERPYPPSRVSRPVRVAEEAGEDPLAGLPGISDEVQE